MPASHPFVEHEHCFQTHVPQSACVAGLANALTRSGALLCECRRLKQPQVAKVFDFFSKHGPGCLGGLCFYGISTPFSRCLGCVAQRHRELPPNSGV